jgi:hypothetical protein
MAKRSRGGGSTRRRARKRDPEPEEEEEEGDDDFAWESPAETKKKKKKKSSKGKTSAKRKGSASARSSRKSGSSSTRKKASSSTRKSGSARRRRRDSEDDDDDEMGNSGRRRRAGPAPKKGVDPIIPISIISVTLLVCLGIFLLGRKPKKIVVDDNTGFETAMSLKKEGMAAFREFNKYKRDGPPDMEVKKAKETITKLQAAIDELNLVFDKYRDAEGFLPKKYEGYEKDYSEMSRIVIDVQAGMRIQ